MATDGASTPTLATDDPVLAAFADEVGTDGPVAVEGGRTRWDLGGGLADGTRVVAAPAGIVDHTPEEMTVTVRAGTPVADLHDALAAKGQRTALPERGGSVGGALVVGESDPRALGRGLVRTALLQVRYVSADGRLVSGGGPTVKNVSGFDLPRLMVGSLGTLGLVAEVILRTNPVPAVSRWLEAHDADPVVVHDRLLAPAAVLWDGASTWVQLEGHGPDVEAQQASLDGLGSFEVVEPPAASGIPVTLPPHRWSLPAGDLGPAAGDNERFGSAFVAAIGLGLVWAEERQPPRRLSDPLIQVSRRLKDNFDPTGRLNPGRQPADR